MKSDEFIIIPSEKGVRIVIKGVSFFKAYTPDMLINMGIRFSEAARDALREKKP